MIVSLTTIYCTSDLKKKRKPTVYRNVTQYNDQQKHSHDSVTNLNILSIWPQEEKNAHCLSERYTV